MKKFWFVVLLFLFLTGGVLPALEDYLDEVSNKELVLKFFNKKDSPEKLRHYIKSVNKKISEQEVNQITQLILKYSKTYDVDYKLVAAVIGQESRFNRNAKSSMGAIGLMQVMPTTAKGVARRIKKQSYQLTMAEDNIQIGTKYLSMLCEEYKDDFNLILAHYNGGYKQAAIYKKYRWFDLLRLIFMNYETYNYVKKVKANYRRLKREF
ncbi:MAG: lytic transglycosylase domain-containing protein [Fibrobacteraceae bacterium]|nr:lytic transglycosylase domain-containing protein [Fibrobacteraceae bacterium]